MQNVIGIRKEDKNQWERRTPIIPEHLRQLREEHYITFYVQPSARRVFPNEDFRNAGALISDDMTNCDVIFGVKEMPLDFFQRGKTYVFFSHTVKGQEKNMPMLKRIMEMGATLIDYEKITDDQGHRRIFFGPHAGMAGITDTLWAVGERLDEKGIDNPFWELMQCYRYRDMNDLEEAYKVVADKIINEGMPERQVPVVIGVAGYGHVARGVRRMLNLLPVIKIKPEELLTLKDRPDLSKHHVYKVVFEEKDMVEPIDPDQPFDLKDYFENPHNYRGVFNKYLPYLTALVNAIYWDARYPRLMTKEDAAELWRTEQRKILVVGDLSCDVGGAVEINTRITDPGNPVYLYNPENGETVDGIVGTGFIVLAIDNLPSELPKPASEDFSKSLLYLIPDIASCDFRESFKNLTCSEMVRRAIIVHKGNLTQRYQYLKDYLK